MKTAMLLLMLSLLVTGCATTRQDRPTINITTLPHDSKTDASKSWQTVQFIKLWPEETEPRFYYDPLIAEQIIYPVLLKYHDRIELWRFHRRAGRDLAGNRFSFIFYTDPDSARLIKEEIRNNDILLRMQDAGLIERTLYDNFNTLPQPKISDTSDPEWPVEVQKSWPYYIMGVSQGWLALIRQITANVPIDANQLTLEELIDHYENVSNAIDLLWLKIGGHAYLHHLSAVFAYQPFEIRY